MQDWIDACKQRQVVYYAVRKAKSDFLKEKINLVRGDSKTFLSSIRKLIPNAKGRNINSVSNHVNNEEELFDTDAANYLNKFFCTIETKLVNYISSYALLNAPPGYQRKNLHCSSQS